MKTITVQIEFHKDITQEQAERFTEAMDADMVFELNEAGDRMIAKSPGKGWGMGRSLVAGVKLID